MAKISEADRKQLIEYAKAAKSKGINHIYLHWSASRYNQVFDDYHINIMGKSSEYGDGGLYFTTDNLAERKSHTWKRNTGAIGITLAAAYGASSNASMGEYPPTKQQLESMKQAVAILCTVLDIPIDKDHVMTHAEAADLDDYGPATTVERWDLMGQGDDIRGGAIWYTQNGIMAE